MQDQLYLRIPGPTPVPPRVLRALAQPMVGHRDPLMDERVARIITRLKPLFGTQGKVFLLAGSGTLALETLLVNLTAPSDEVLVVTNGNFGERFAAIARDHKRNVHTLSFPPGVPTDPEAFRSALVAHPNLRAVIVTHCETSTSLLNPVRELAAIVREVRPEALVLVDGVSSIAGVEMAMDAWGIDGVATGSQKALMSPPGLAVVALGPRALEAMRAVDGPRFYADLRRYEDSLAKNTTPFTPAVSLLFALDEALNLIEEEGYERVFARHLLMRDMTRAGIRALGLPLLVEDDAYASPTVTAVDVEALGPKRVLATLREHFAVVFASGQGDLTPRIVRIGHMGYVSPSDVLHYLAAFEVSLELLGHPVRRGAAVAAAAEVYTAWATALSSPTR